MAMGPINYGALSPELDVTPLLQGLQIGEQRRYRRAQADLAQQQIDAAQQKAATDAERQAAYQAAVGEVIKNPSAEAYQRLFLQFPEMREATDKGLSAYTDAQKNRNLDAAMSVAGLLNAGNTTAALDVLKKRRDALKGNESTEITDALIGMIESGDAEQIAKAKGLAGFAIAAQMGDKAGSVLGRLGFSDKSELKGYGPGSWVFDDTGNVVAKVPFAPGTGDYTLSEGQSRYSGQGGSGSGGGVPLTQRTNNPGAIKDGSWARSQPGYAGSEGGFARFNSTEAGTAAHRRLIGQNYIGKGINTPSAIVERYAPVGENSPDQVLNYKRYIAQRLGIGVNDKIPASRVPELQKAMSEFESGVGKQSGAGAGVIATNPKAPKRAAPSETRSVNGKVYVKVEGRWYLQGGA